MRRQKSEELKKERNDRIKQFLKDMIAPTIFVIIVVFVLYKMATYERPAEENDIPATYAFGYCFIFNVLYKIFGAFKYEFLCITPYFTKVAFLRAGISEKTLFCSP